MKGKNLITALGLSTLLLTGCGGSGNNQTTRAQEEVPKPVPYFAKILGVDVDSGMTMTSGDFDNDGDSDVIVGAINHDTAEGRTYFLENDGKRKFKPKRYLPENVSVIKK